MSFVEMVVVLPRITEWPKIRILLLRCLRLFSLLGFVVISNSIPPLSYLPLPTTDNYHETVLGIEGGRIVFEGMDIFIPPNSLDHPFEIRVERVTEDEVPPLLPGMINVTLDGGGYRILPENLKLKEKATVQLPLRENLIGQDGNLNANVQTFIWVEPHKTWVPLNNLGVNQKSSRTVSQTGDFGTMINGILTSPESPSPLQFNPNSIKDFAAVEPTANVDLIQPPVANNQGTAELNYPIQLPAGRGAYSPSLTLNYSSARGNGWLGLGWDIPISRIEIDTRWGVPSHDGTERYLLDGSALVPVSTSEDELKCKADGSDAIQYATRIESFQRILKCGMDSDYWWEITSKDGTRYEYGFTILARLYSHQNEYSGNRGKDSGIWYLERVIDTNNNTTSFGYETVTVPSDYEGEPYLNKYISNILYTTHPSETFSIYEVEFVRDNCENRPDPISNARYGFLVVTSCLLEKINVNFVPKSGAKELIRSYSFIYHPEVEVFGYKSLLQAVQVQGKNLADFYEHTFEYNQPDFDPNLQVYTSVFKTKFLSGPDPNNDQDFLLSHTSQESHNFSVGASIGIGVGAGSSATQAGCEVGVTAGTSWEFPTPQLRQADITGDGIVDHVWLSNNGTKMSNYITNQSFQNTIGLPTVGSESSAGNLSLGVGAGCNVGALGVNAGVSYSTGKDSTNSVLADANGDGYTDLSWGSNSFIGGMPNQCRDGNAPENGVCSDGLRVCSTDNDACFGSPTSVSTSDRRIVDSSLVSLSSSTPTSGLWLTSLPLSVNNSSLPQFQTNTPTLAAQNDWGSQTAIQSRLEIEHNLAGESGSPFIPDLSHYRPVIRWDAAYSGTIDLSVIARRMYLLACESEENCGDGVKVTILRAQNGYDPASTITLGDLTIESHQSGWNVIPGSGIIEDVKFGESFLVVVDALDDIPIASSGTFIDEVELNIQIDYVEVCPPGIGEHCYSINESDIEVLDLNGNPTYRFSYPQDFRLSELPKLNYWQLLPPIGPSRINPDGSIDKNQITGAINKTSVVDTPVHIRVRCESVVSQQANDGTICPMGTVLREYVFEPDEIGEVDFEIDLPQPFRSEFRVTGFLNDSDTSPGNMGFVWYSEKKVLFETGHFYDANNSENYSTNELGHIVGQATSEMGELATLWTAENGLQSLGIRGGASAINNNGIVVGRGWPNDLTEPAKGFIWQSDLGLTILELPNTRFSSISDINNKNQVVGRFALIDRESTPNLNFHDYGFFWDDSNNNLIPEEEELVVFPSEDQPSSYYFQSVSRLRINDEGYVIGEVSQYNFASRVDEVRRSFIWFDEDEDGESEASEFVYMDEGITLYAINNNNQIAGSFILNDIVHAGLWTFSETTNNWELEDLGPNLRAIDLNDNGHILVTTTRIDINDISSQESIVIYPDRSSLNLSETIGEDIQVTSITNARIFEPIRLMFEIDGENGVEIPTNAIEWNPHLEIVSIYDLADSTFPGATNVIISNIDENRSIIWEEFPNGEQNLLEIDFPGQFINSMGNVIGVREINGENILFYWNRQTNEAKTLQNVPSIRIDDSVLFGLREDIDFNNSNQIVGKFEGTSDVFLWEPERDNIIILGEGDNPHINDNGTVIFSRGDDIFKWKAGSENRLDLGYIYSENDDYFPPGYYHDIPQIISINNEESVLLKFYHLVGGRVDLWNNTNEKDTVEENANIGVADFDTLNNTGVVVGQAFSNPSFPSLIGDWSYIWYDYNKNKRREDEEVYYFDNSFKALGLGNNSKLVGLKQTQSQLEPVLLENDGKFSQIPSAGINVSPNNTWMDVSTRIEKITIANNLSYLEETSTWQQEMPVLYRVHPNRDLTPFVAPKDNLVLEIVANLRNANHPLIISILDQHLRELEKWKVEPSNQEFPFDNRQVSLIRLPKAGIYYVRAYTEASFDVNTTIDLKATLYGYPQILLVHRERALNLIGKIPLTHDEIDMGGYGILVQENSIELSVFRSLFQYAYPDIYEESEDPVQVLYDFARRSFNPETIGMLLDADIYREILANDPEILESCCVLVSMNPNGSMVVVPKAEVPNNLLKSNFGGQYDLVLNNGQWKGTQVSEYLDQVGEVWYSYESFGGGHRGFFYGEIKGGVELRCVSPYSCFDEDIASEIIQVADTKIEESANEELVWELDLRVSSVGAVIKTLATNGTVELPASTLKVNFQIVAPNTQLAQSIQGSTISEVSSCSEVQLSYIPITQGILLRDGFDLSDLNKPGIRIFVANLQYSIFYAEEKYPIADKEVFEIEDIEEALLDRLNQRSDIFGVSAPLPLLEKYANQVSGFSLIIEASNDFGEGLSCILDADNDGNPDCDDDCLLSSNHGLECCSDICMILGDCEDPECFQDSDLDGIPDCIDDDCNLDFDNDGLVDCRDDLCSKDSNRNGIRDCDDLSCRIDSNNNGVLDCQEPECNKDSDSDGLVNCRDPHPDDDSKPGTAPPDDPDGDGVDNPDDDSPFIPDDFDDDESSRTTNNPNEKTPAGAMSPRQPHRSPEDPGGDRGTNCFYGYLGKTYFCNDGSSNSGHSDSSDNDGKFEAPEDLQRSITSSFNASIGVGINLGGPTLGFGISRGVGSTWSDLDYMDWNGDGLPDQISPNIIVLSGTNEEIDFELECFYELDGNCFTYPTIRDYANLTEGGSASFGLGLGMDLQTNANGSVRRVAWNDISLGLNSHLNTSSLLVDRADINGDGLPDIIIGTPGSNERSVEIVACLNFVYRLGECESWGELELYDSSASVGGVAQRTTESAFGVFVERGALSQTESVSFGTDVGVDFAVDVVLVKVGFKGGRRDNNTTSQGRISFTDINGDGLADYVLKDPPQNALIVYFNTGQGFNPTPIKIAVPDWTIDPIIGNRGFLPTSLGVNLVNDLVGESADVLQLNGSETTTYSGELEARVLIFGGSISYGWSEGSSFSEMGFYDIDGDGLPDRVLRIGNEPGNIVMQTQENRLGNVNLLTKVDRPFGGQIVLEYEPNIPTELDPSTRWVLNNFVLQEDPTLSNPYSISPPIQYEFEYEEPFYDRYERKFYGFKTVRTIRAADEQVTEEIYANRNYWLNGTLLSTSVFEGIGINQVLYQETLYETGIERQTQDNSIWTNCLNDSKLPLRQLDNSSLRDLGATPCDVYFVYPESVIARQYEGGATYQETALYYEAYDEYGNLTQFRDAQNIGIADDDVVAVVTYEPTDELLGAYILDRPETISVYSVRSSGELDALLRYRRGEYDDRGNLIRHGILNEYRPDIDLTTTNILSDSMGLQVSSLTLAYDAFGFTTAITDTMGYRVDYIPETEIHMFAVETTDSLGLSASTEYDYAFQLPVRQTDINGHELVTEYDEFGRLEIVQGPYELAAGENSLEVDYSPQVCPILPRCAITTNTAVDPRTNTISTSIDTAIFVDGLGRVIQTQIDGEVNGELGHIVSGEVVFDASGRLIKQGQPDFRMGSTITPTVNMANDARSTQWDYDVLDRAVQVTEPGNLITQFNYEIGTAPHDDRLTTLQTEISDPEGKIRYEHYDAANRLVAVVQRYNSQDLVTSYTYQPTGELLTISDARDNVSEMEYDLVGRRTAVTTPDTGRLEIAYDANGNLTAKTDQELCQVSSNILIVDCTDNQKIRYEYDQASRLVLIDYPDNGLMDVRYVYGDADEDNECINRGNIEGRVCLVEDGSGAELRSFGALGEITGTVRIMQGAAWEINADRTFTTTFTFDSFGRMLAMEYPDGDELQYGYDAGGNIQTVISATVISATPVLTYVSDILYDEYGQRTKITFGNGVVTEYQYEPETRRLDTSTISSPAAATTLVRDLDYDYDQVGNIDQIIEMRPIGVGVSNTVTRTYGYDDLHRLTNFSYETAGPEDGSGPLSVFSTVNGSFGYDPVGNITSQFVNRTAGTTTLSAYPSRMWTYDYNTSTRPNLPNTIGPYSYTYNDRGAITSSVRLDGSDAPTGMTYTWDEEGRLNSSQPQGSDEITTYLYNDEGQRIRKETITSAKSDSTIYPNEFYTARFARQTANSCSGTGVCWENEVSTSKHIYIEQERIAVVAGVINVESSPSDALTELTVEDRDKMVQYFHPDPVGSTMMATNASGTFSREIDYLPYGEVLLEQNYDHGFPQDILFNGKELDAETGLHYFGARYYDSKIGRWASADPLYRAFPESELEQPAELNLFAFGLNNPISNYDHTGLKPQQFTNNIERKAPSETTTRTSNVSVIVTYDTFLGIEFGSHAAIIVQTPRESILFDPGGSFMGTKEYPRGTADILTTEDHGDTLLSTFVNYHKGTGSRVELFNFSVTEKEAGEIVERIFNIGGTSGGLCSIATCQAIQGIGPFEKVDVSLLPGNLADQMQAIKNEQLRNQQ